MNRNCASESERPARDSEGRCVSPNVRLQPLQGRSDIGRRTEISETPIRECAALIKCLHTLLLDYGPGGNNQDEEDRTAFLASFVSQLNFPCSYFPLIVEFFQRRRPFRLLFVEEIPQVG